VAAAGLRKPDAAWGALVATGGFEALKIGFAQYVAHFGNYDATYGTIGFLVALLAFFYLGAQVMLIGAEVAESRMLVTTAGPPERYRETEALRSRIGSVFSGVRRRLGLSPGATALSLPPSAASPSGPQPIAPRDTPVETPGVQPAEAAERRGGGGSFLWGLLLGIAAGLTFRRHQGD